MNRRSFFGLGAAAAVVPFLPKVAAAVAPSFGLVTARGTAACIVGQGTWSTAASVLTVRFDGKEVSWLEDGKIIRTEPAEPNKSYLFA